MRENGNQTADPKLNLERYYSSNDEDEDEEMNSSSCIDRRNEAANGTSPMVPDHSTKSPFCKGMDNQYDYSVFTDNQTKQPKKKTLDSSHPTEITTRIYAAHLCVYIKRRPPPHGMETG